MIVKTSVINGYWNICVHVRWSLSDWRYGWLGDCSDANYLEPSERAAFDDDAFLVLERELFKVLVPVGTFRANPFEKEEE